MPIAGRYSDGIESRRDRAAHVDVRGGSRSRHARPLLVALVLVAASRAAAACAASTADYRPSAADAPSPPTCRQIEFLAGDGFPSAVQWHEPEGARSRAALDAWCRGVGPVVYQSHPPKGRDESLPIRATGPIAIVSWNVNVGAGHLPALVADLRGGKWSDGRRVEHFVLLLQEALRAGDAVPPRSPSQAGARRLRRGPPRVDIVSFARDQGLSLLYIPSMRNGFDASAPAEDRGNAIVSTLPLLAPAALELPFVRQRRVAVFATLGAPGGDEPLWVASVHLDHVVGASRLWVFCATRARGRQARAITAVLPPRAPVVIGGDFNTWFGTNEPALREMARVTGQSPQAREATYASGAVLDHLFFRTPAVWNASYAGADHKYGSDHLPLVGWIDRRLDDERDEERGPVRFGHRSGASQW
jgi:endonuclease/exonuclease/phosphatase family metal-dependent hydrolase